MAGHRASEKFERLKNYVVEDNCVKKDWRSFLAKGLVFVATAFFALVVGCATPGMRHSAQNLQAPAASPKLLAVYMPWFGDHSHIDVGYSSQDPGMLRQQIQQARQRGISGFVVDWNGERRPYADHNFGILEQVASENHFHVALLYNEAEDDDSQATEDAMAAFDKAYRAYIGPQAPYRDAYLTYEGRPLIFIFPKGGHTDWNRIRDYCSKWESPPLILYKDQPPAQYAGALGGAYPWVQPGKDGWKPDGSNWGEEYLENFYKMMRSQPSDKVVVGAAWPGFDDSAAKWGLNRHMSARCGQTLDDTMALYHHYYDAEHPLPFLLIETWNDYEEGTAIERLSAANCGKSGDQQALQQSGSR
jgi:hypothetical protein